MDLLVNLYGFLVDRSIDVYFVGQHKGECVKPYVVLKDGGISSLNGKAGTKYLDLIFFIPQNRFTAIQDYKELVMGYVKEFGCFKYTGNETSTVIDDEKKALTFSITYQNLRKLEG